MPDHFLGVQDASVSFGEGGARVPVLHDVSVEFAPGTLTLVMGPSGSGKTTLLSLLGCLLTPDAGAVYIDGAPVNTLSESARTRIRQQKISFVFQAFRLFHSLTALDNVVLGFELRGFRGGERIGRAEALLQSFGLAHKRNQLPSGLSPGEKQRVAIARALAGNPPIILADEPTASLDFESGKNVCEILRAQVDQAGKTVVVVSHDPRWHQYADRTIVLAYGQLQNDGLQHAEAAKGKAIQ